MEGCEPSGQEHHAKLHSDIQTTLKGKGTDNMDPKLKHTHARMQACTHAHAHIVPW